MKPVPVTVLLPVYNGEAWLKDALASVLRQSFREFELLVIDDGSTDRTPGLLAACADTRLKTVRHERNKGLIATLNSGIDHAQGRFLARMDQDDIMHPRRLELQVTFLEANPEVGVCGTWFWWRDGTRRRFVRPPTHHDDIDAHLFFRSPFGHPTTMLRRTFLDRVGTHYDPDAVHAEDFDLWVRARGHTKFANLPRYLLEYRRHQGQISAKHVQVQSASASRIRLRQLAMMLPNATPEEQHLHLRSCDGYQFAGRKELLEARAWLDLLSETNRRIGMFTLRGFGRALASAWAHCCFRATLSPRDVLRIYLSRRYSPLGLDRLREISGLAYRAFALPGGRLNR